MNVAYALSAYPAGSLSDRASRKSVLLIGFALLVLANAVLAFASPLWAVAIGVTLWGLHMGFTQGLFSALIADAVPPELRGTGFGVFNLFQGVALLAASAIAGGLWDIGGPRATFTAGALFALLSGAGLLATGKRLAIGADT